MGWPTLANQAEYDERSGSRKLPLSQVLDWEPRLLPGTNSSVGT